MNTVEKRIVVFCHDTLAQQVKKFIPSAQPGFVILYNYADTIHEYLRKVHIGRGYTLCEL